MHAILAHQAIMHQSGVSADAAKIMQGLQRWHARFAAGVEDRRCQHIVKIMHMDDVRSVSGNCLSDSARAVFRIGHALCRAKFIPAGDDLIVVGDELMDFMAVGAQQTGFIVHHSVFAAEAALISIMNLKNALARSAPDKFWAILQPRRQGGSAKNEQKVKAVGVSTNGLSRIWLPGSDSNQRPSG